MKKSIISLALAALTIPLISSSAHADVPSADVRQVARVLINNLDITRKLKENNSDALANIDITKVQEGVYKYEMRFVRQCECLPSTADVTIIEDLRPTEVDGPIKYTSSIKITDKP